MPNETSQSYDAVLGGHRPAPVGGLVLGGLVGLQQQFEAKDVAVQIAALVNAVDFGDEAISLLLQGFNSEVLQIRGVAYNLLKQIGSVSAIAAAGEGVPLRVGDRIYGVYRSTITYDDEWYSIDSSISERQSEECPIYQFVKNEVGQEVCYVTDEPKPKRDIYDEDDYDYEGYYHPKLLKFSLTQLEADALAKQAYKQAFLDTY